MEAITGNDILNDSAKESDVTGLVNKVAPELTLIHAIQNGYVPGVESVEQHGIGYSPCKLCSELSDAHKTSIAQMRKSTLYAIQQWCIKNCGVLFPVEDIGVHVSHCALTKDEKLDAIEKMTTSVNENVFWNLMKFGNHLASKAELTGYGSSLIPINNNVVIYRNNITSYVSVVNTLLNVLNKQ